MTKYKSERNEVVTLLRKSKTKYFQDLGQSTQKQFWKAVKLVKGQECSIPALKDGSTVITSNSGKAQLLNEFFHNNYCFNDSFSPLMNPTLLDTSRCPPHLLYTEEEVTDLLLSLDPAKSTGLDKISAVMLWSTAVYVATLLLFMSTTDVFYQASEIIIDNLMADFRFL